MTEQLSLDAAAHPLAPILDRLDREVPAWMGKAAALGGYERRAEAEACADVIAHGADALWHPAKPTRRKHAGPTADDVLGAIARGTAILALRPGGIRLADRHWCTQDQPDCEGCDNPPAFDITRVDVDTSRTGAHFTPRPLAELVARHTLSALTCSPGPLQTADSAHWQAGPVRSWWPITVADIAMGSGAFLVAAARHIAQHLAQGNRLHQPAGTWAPGWQAMLPAVIETCLYGADVNPWSVDLARLALGLLVPFDPTPNLDRHLVAGDALAGTHRPGQDPAPLDARFPDRHPVHWPQAFPEVFTPHCEHGPGFDAIVGNPPFLGGQKLTAAFGQDYREHLIADLAKGKRGSADLAAYFALRAHQLVNRRGQAGLIATNTLPQGDTRQVGLDQIVADGVRIRGAHQSAPWPGAASVHYCVAITTRAPMASDAQCLTEIAAELDAAA